MSQRIVVIGSNSFSGSDYIDYLLEDPENEVVGISRSPEKGALYLPYKRHAQPAYRFVQADLNTDREKIFKTLDDFKPSYVVNFACQSEVAPSWEHPGQWFQTNGVALAEFTNALRKATYLKRYVHIGSPEVYGACRDITEETPPNPSTPYAASRAAGDLFLFTLVKRYQFPMTMIRATNVYGAHQQLFKIIPRAMIYIRFKRSVPLHGGGQAIKSYIHIRDVSRATRLIMEKGKNGEIYHLSPDESVSIRNLVKQVCEVMEVDFARAVLDEPERPGQDAAYVINSLKAREAFGWKPQVSLAHGLKEVRQWLDQYWDQIQHEPLEYIHKP